MTRSLRPRPVTLKLGLTLLLALTLGARCKIGISQIVQHFDSSDAMLSGDWFNVVTGRYVELGPGAPLVGSGPDGLFGTADDSVSPSIVGDTDLVMRSGITDFAGAIPDPSPLVGAGSEPQGIAALFGQGTEIDFVVVASDGGNGATYGTPVSPPYFSGLPILAIAFADLDGDGFVGVTLQDGVAEDAALEASELHPVGRNFAFANGDRAAGSLRIQVGGPLASPVRVVLAAVAFTGFTDPGFLGGTVPVGPAVMTQLPFLPLTDPGKVFQGGPSGPPAALPGENIGVKIKADLVPDPTNPGYGEAYTLRTDGSSPTIDVAVMRSGSFSRFGVARIPDPTLYRQLDSRPLKRGVSELGSALLYEVPQLFSIADDGPAGTATMRVVALDRLGNITDVPGTTLVTVRVTGGIQILSPDSDGFPEQETLSVSDAAGATLVLDDRGGSFDDANGASITLEGAGTLSKMAVTLPDPDVDDNGVVDAFDVALILPLDDIEEGEAGFDPNFDLDGNGLIDLRDRAIVSANFGLSGVSIP